MTIKNITDTVSIKNYPVLYISPAARSELPALFRSTNGRQIVSIGGNISSFCEQGGIINITGTTNMPYQLNHRKALSQRIIVAPIMLRFAEIVE